MARKDKKKKVAEPSYEEPTSYDTEDTEDTYGTSGEVSEDEIVLKDGNEEGLAAIVKIIEEVSIEQDHDANVSVFNFTGKLNVENPSTVDRLWDINIVLENIDNTNLESSEILVQELGTEEGDNIDSREFEISGEASNLLLVKEFINTLPEAGDILNISDVENALLKLQGDVVDETDEDTDIDADTEDDMMDDGGALDAEEASLEAFGISINKLNTVTMVIAMRNTYEKQISEVKVIKNIPDEFENVLIVDTSIGMADIEGNQVLWNIDELEPETTVFIKLTVDIQTDQNEPIKTGTIEITHKAVSSFSGGLGVEKFEAYSRNGTYVDIIEKDDKPGVWDCKLVFENDSEFTVQLMDVDVYAPEDESNKLITVDPEKEIKLPAGASWQSVPWEYESDVYPSFNKKPEFSVLHEIAAEVSSVIAISDVELGLSSITGEISYSVDEEAIGIEQEEGLIKVPTYKVSQVNAVLKVTNDGSAPLNEVSFTQQPFSDEFLPPSVEDITLLWDGKEVALEPEQVVMEDNVLTVKFEDLKDSSQGLFNPNSTLEFQYPITVENPREEAKFDSEIVIRANTHPKSQELEFIPEADEIPVIEAVHIRRKFRLGKKVLAIGDLGNYKITLHMENVGNYTLKDFTIKDKVPDNFDSSNYSLEPESVTDKGEEIIQWTIEELEEGNSIEITYEMVGTGDYNPKEAQISL